MHSINYKHKLKRNATFVFWHWKRALTGSSVSKRLSILFSLSSSAKNGSSVRSHIRTDLSAEPVITISPKFEIARHQTWIYIVSLGENQQLSFPKHTKINTWCQDSSQSFKFEDRDSDIKITASKLKGWFRAPLNTLVLHKLWLSSNGDFILSWIHKFIRMSHMCSFPLYT